MAAKKRNPEGRVNVALGADEQRLASAATQAGVTKYMLARILILNGLEMLTQGKWKVRQLGVETND